LVETGGGRMRPPADQAPILNFPSGAFYVIIDGKMGLDEHVQLIVRQIEERVVQKLKQQAGAHGVSMEEEHRASCGRRCWAVPLDLPEHPGPLMFRMPAVSSVCQTSQVQLAGGRPKSRTRLPIPPGLC